ncbi:MAG: serine/threonine protein kinase [Planctomycetes bacterium]|nr:serine/threonine protein kinase [Planctomycetota bacterium]
MSVRVGPYELLDRLGQGGMGTVHRARHVDLGVVRAVKLLRAGGARGPAAARATARFEREARALAQVRHDNVVAIHESGVRPEDGAPWLAMDLVAGRPLDEVVAGGPLPWGEALALMVPLCRGVDALHAAGIVHRDLKPQNVIVAADGRPVVIDLGLAVAPERDERLTATGAFVGTPHYMAPEQVDAREAISPRTDVHALGLILYELVTGEQALAQESTSVHQVMGALLASERPRPSDRAPDLPLALDEVCGRAMARDPAARYETAGALADALAAVRAPGARSVRRAAAPRAGARRRPGGGGGPPGAASPWRTAGDQRPLAPDSRPGAWLPRCAHDGARRRRAGGPGCARGRPPGPRRAAARAGRALAGALR